MIPVVSSIKVNYTNEEKLWGEKGKSICSESDIQWDQEIVSDGSGGAIITWRDRRNGNYDIYAQRIDSSGNIKWALNGIPICTTAEDQTNLQICSDGVGGAIIIWRDSRNGDFDIFSQRIDSSGNTKWTLDGIPICISTNHQSNLQLHSDGVGGAIITWEDERNSEYDIYAQRINSSGINYWTVNGISICNAASTQSNPQINIYNQGGAIITWQDNRSGTFDIYTQRVNSSGDVNWTVNGIPICTATGNQQNPQISLDGAGGAFFVWNDQRAGNNIYAQRVNSSGDVNWTINGILIDNIYGYDLQIINDGFGEAVIIWDRSSGSEDVYAQRINSSGIIQWDSNGLKISTSGDRNVDPRILRDGLGNLYFIWEDIWGNGGVYAQKINSAGEFQWQEDIQISSIYGSYHGDPEFVSDGSGGIIVTWNYDYSPNSRDILAQRISISTDNNNDEDPSSMIFGFNIVIISFILGLSLLPMIISFRNRIEYERK